MKMAREQGGDVMKKNPIQTTWDGKEISPEPPYGSMVVVYRFIDDDLWILLLHRAHHGTVYEGDWAWTPPSGARQPGEAIEVCARRELEEEAGLILTIQLTDCGDEEWYVYVAEDTEECIVRLIDQEHDRYEWVRTEEAVSRCKPERVSASLERAIVHVRGK